MVATDEREDKLFHCHALTTIKLISGKWKTRILWLLRERAHSFNELRRTLPGVSGIVLAEQIAQLEDAGLVCKRKVERDGLTYSDIAYTTYGLSLLPVLDGLGEWGLKHRRSENQR